MSKFFYDKLLELYISNDIESVNSITEDSNNFEEVYKKVFSNEEKDNYEFQKDCDRLHFSTENLSSNKNRSNLNSINTPVFSIFNISEQKNNETKNILGHKKRRKTQEKEGNINYNSNKKKHNKYDKDNVLIKIQIHYMNFIIHFLNAILSLFKYNKKERFCLIDHELKQKVNKEYSDHLKTLKLGDIAKMKKSPKFKTLEKKHNENIYNKIINNPYMKNIFEENYN